MNFILALSLCISPIWALPLQTSANQTSYKAPRIIGGTEARPGQFPSQVAVYFDTDDGTYFCGGSLINHQWILTSAHCVHDAKIFTLHLGSNTLISDDPNRLTVATVNAVSHPQFNPDTLENDLGLIKLHLPITFNSYIQPILLPSVDVQPDSRVIATGWGQVGDWGTGVVNSLNYVVLSVIANEECQKTYGAQIDQKMVCAAGNFNEGTCSGDTGGPLISLDNGGHGVHVGTSSFVSSNGCESIDPSGFTRTFPYVDWIRQTTQQ